MMNGFVAIGLDAADGVKLPFLANQLENVFRDRRDVKQLEIHMLPHLMVFMVTYLVTENM